MSHEKILILDYGSQYNQLIARRVRELNVYCELHPFNISIEKIKALNPKGIILSGGPSSVFDEDAPDLDMSIFDLNIPVLGICYGMQILTKKLNGEISKAKTREYGYAELIPSKDSPLFNEIPLNQNTQVWMSHGDSIETPAEGFDVIGLSQNGIVSAIANENKQIYGVQFHPEVQHSLCGKTLIKNFLYEICQLKGDWTMANFRQEAIKKIREQTKNQKVMLGLSGGVDSSVLAVLLHEAIGDKLTCIFVDNGLLRKDEAGQVMELFTNSYDIKVEKVDAEKDFLDKLAGITDPEDKRKCIGEVFIRCFEKKARSLNNINFLAQGTIYPDVIESSSFKGGPSQTIKSHHNVGGLPDDLNLELVEPLRELFKDEVRALGLELGLPKDMVYRHPFPGPGLGVRILGDITKEKCDKLREADAIFIKEIREAGIYDEIAQAFVVLLPVKSVGVMGDGRTYENVVALRAVQTTDFMTATIYPFKYDFLNKVSNKQYE
ncbi:MAG: glutamine-hydrolyzing GMP synthase [Planctomycetota bacterium]|nr:MAG: glutamine-hydrolyzing GMP synthase [Planctomycetota bacterium]